MVPKSPRRVVDDFVRVMGVIFNDELLRGYLPDMVGSTKNGNRNEIDGSRPGARSGFRRMWDRFIDEEVVVTLPKLWGTKESIARLELRTPGAFEQHGWFNPNNLQRISLPWLEKDVVSLFRHVLSVGTLPNGYTQWLHTKRPIALTTDRQLSLKPGHTYPDAEPPICLSRATSEFTTA